MARTRSTFPTLCGLAALVALGAVPPAAAQEVYVEPVVSRYVAGNVPVAEVLDHLFSEFGLRYRVEGRLPERSISVRLRRLPLSEAIEKVARQAGASVLLRHEGATCVLEWKAPTSPRATSTPQSRRPLAQEEPVPGVSAAVPPMIFPIAGPVTWTDTWNTARDNGRRRHHGQDLMAPKMTPLVAVWDGVVTLSTSRSGHNTLRLHGDHGYMAWYMHLNNDTPGTDDGLGTAEYAFAPGLKTGDRVVAGQFLGWVGDSGNAEGTAPHCHFELHGPDGVFNPAPWLRAAQKLDAPLGSVPTIATGRNAPLAGAERRASGTPGGLRTRLASRHRVPSRRRSPSTRP